MSSSSVSPSSSSLPLLISSPLDLSFRAPSTHFSSSRIDLRSDTVTQPTPSMRIAMAEAEVGDDVFGDDPTILKLQSTAASLLNKEAALFVPSGTMSNLIAVLSWCRERGSEVLLGADSHVHLYEQGGISTLGSVHPRVVNNKLDGTLDLDEIKSKIRSLTDDHAPWTKLVILEQTHNRCGGTVLPVEYIDKVGKLCKENHLKLHIDGARLFNAVIASGISAARMVEAADSISICLSKGLGAPVGSLLVGPRDFITFAKRVRKSLGGGMRQAGTIAAAGLVALTSMVDRLVDDHSNARYLAESLSKLSALPIHLSTVQTNLVFVPVDINQLTINANDIITKLREQNILAVAIHSSLIRFVLHYQITKDDVDKVIKAVHDIIQKHTK